MSVIWKRNIFLNGYLPSIRTLINVSGGELVPINIVNTFIQDKQGIVPLLIMKAMFLVETRQNQLLVN
jgi:hypothetical protein